MSNKKEAPARSAAPTRRPDDSASHYEFSDQVGHLLRRAYQRHTALFQQSIPDSKLTVGQFVVLCALRDHVHSSIIDLVKLTVIDQSTIRGVVDRLKSRDLIKLETDPGDRRKVIASLNPAGKRMVEEMEPFARTITEETFGTLNEAERVALLYLLKKMIGPEPNPGHANGQG